MDIRFCDHCDASIPGVDLDRGMAARLQGQLLCAVCLPATKRQRILSFLLKPLALLAAVALGAAAAVWLLTPRIDELRDEVAALRTAATERPAVDPSVVETLDRLGELGQSLVLANEGMESAARRRDEAVSAALLDCQEKIATLAAGIVEIREFLAAAAAPPEVVDPPKAVPGVAEDQPAEPPRVDLETWLPFTADPDSGVRLSALVALEPSADPRVLVAARTALTDGDEVVRAQAAKMLADRDDQESVPALVDLLLDPNARVRVVAHRALETLTGLELSFDSADSDETRRAAVQAIRELLGG